MPSKRSRAWHQRKLAESAAARLTGKFVHIHTATNAKITFGGQVLESFKDFSFTETGRVLEKPRHIDDRADALAYSLKQQQEVKEAAQRLAGTYSEPMEIPDWGFDKLKGSKDDPLRTPRLDGRRWKK